MGILDKLGLSKTKNFLEQREDVLLQAKALEISSVSGNLSQEQYERENKKFHLKIIILDRQIVIEKLGIEIDALIQENLNRFNLNEFRQIKFDEIMKIIHQGTKDIRDAYSLYTKGRMDPSSFEELLSERQSELMEIQRDLEKMFVAQAEDKVKQDQILMEVKQELKNQKAQEIADELAIQIPRGEFADFPDPPKQEALHRHTRRHAEL
ncbi:hypothetical protein IIC68_03440 [archaeon]|nr:hypothetical protein [archaeon]